MPQLNEAFKCSSCLKLINDSNELGNDYCICCHQKYHSNCPKLSSHYNSTGYCFSCYTSTFPFLNLSDNEFQTTLNELHFGPSRLGPLDYMDQLHINPLSLYDKYKDTLNTSDELLSKGEDRYILDNELNSITSTKNLTSSNCFSLIHINARSLNKNIESISHLIDSVYLNFNITGITETWIKESSSLVNINNYEFICKGRVNKSGGGVGMYILEKTKYKVREDLSLSESMIESIFIEIINDKAKNSIIGVFIDLQTQI